MEEYFPRGGRPKPGQEEEANKKKEEEEKARHRHRKKRSLEDDKQEKGDDFLFGKSTKKKKSSKHKSSKHSSSNTNQNDDDAFAAATSSKHSLLPLGGGGVVMKKRNTQQSSSQSSKAVTTSTSSNNIKAEPFIEALGFSRLAKGTKLLGIVREVQEEFALVSLPNLLTGYVLRNESGTTLPLTQILSVGQVLAVVVVRTVTEHVGKAKKHDPNTNTKRRIQVSVAPQSVNLLHEQPTPKFPIRGRVQAVEDNGLLIDLGHGRKGFLPFDQMDENTYKVKDNTDDDDDDDDNEKNENNNNNNNNNNESDEYDSDDDRIPLHVGRISDFIVGKGAKSATDIVPLSLPSPDQMAKHMIPSDSMPSIQAILPGWLVKVKVEAVARNGLCVAFLGNVFRGSIDLAHLGGFWIPSTRQSDGSAEWKNHFRDDGQSLFPIIRSFTARILAVDAATKTIRLTVLPHLMDLRSPPSSFLPPTGTVVKNATVIKLDPGVGALLALPPKVSSKAQKMDVDKENEENGSDDDDDVDDGDGDGDDDAARSFLHQPLCDKESYKQATKVRAVYVHISKAMDEIEDGKTSEAAFAKEFAPSTTHTVRILSTSNLVEGVASGATAGSIINAHVLTYADLVPGNIFRKVPVIAHLERGAVLVEFGMEVRGLLSVHHLFDQAGTSEYRTKMLKAKYGIGSKVDVRVLSCDPTTKRCFVTAKKSLLQATDVLTTFQDCKVGQTATGVVSKVDDQGLFVTFFNKVYGRVPARSLALELGIDDHRENYQVGNVVQCRIANKKRVRRGRRRPHDYSDEEDSDHDGDSRFCFWELTLSLRVNANEEDGEDSLLADDQASHHKVHLRAGVVLPPKSMKVVSLMPGKTKANGTFVPGYAIVSVKSKYLVDEAESAAMLPYVECKLPYDNLLDEYEPTDVDTSASLDALAGRILSAGKKLNCKGVLLTDPKKSKYEYSSGTGSLTVISIRPKLVEVAETQSAQITNKTTDGPMLPGPYSHLYEGANVIGYVAHVHDRHGAFVRFLDGLTGLVPKNKNGTEFDVFSTIVSTIETIDHLSSPPKILLSAAPKQSFGKKSPRSVGVSNTTAVGEDTPFRDGDVIEEAEIENLDFYNASLIVLDKKWNKFDLKARIHCTMAACESYDPKKAKTRGKDTKAGSITKFHPFSRWSVGMKLRNLKVVAATMYNGTCFTELTDRKSELPTILTRSEQAPEGSQVSGIVRQIARFNSGVYVALGPKLTGFIPGVECSSDLDVLNNLPYHFPVGSNVSCKVIDKLHWCKLKAQATNSYSARFAEDIHPEVLFLSVLADSSPLSPPPTTKPKRGDLVIGQIQRSLQPLNPPALMLELRGGYVGRCCITELEEADEWCNMPLGHNINDGNEELEESAIVSGDSDVDDAQEEVGRVPGGKKRSHDESFPSGKYVLCRVLAGVPSRPVVDVSLRSSRVEGDLDDDETPEEGEMCHAYVIDTNKGGCFVRLSRNIEGRVMLKELTDDFLPNPSDSFPPGRLVVGKVKQVKEMKTKKHKKTVVEIDLRESTVLQSQQLQFADIQVNSKYKGTVTRVEPFGVFVRLENSTVSGLVHKSECSDKFVKNVFDLYDPGDLVKVLVIKKDDEEHKIGFSMKASHFVDDEDSDDESLSVAEPHGNDDDDDDNGSIEMPDVVPDRDGGDDELDSDDPDFASKLARSKSGNDKSGGDSTDDESCSNSSSDSDDEDKKPANSDSEDDSSDNDDDPPKKSNKSATDVMDTDVGFAWSASAADLAENSHESDSDSDGENMDDDDDDAMAASSSHKSRKKQAQKRREEQEISRREIALADGTADENPETAADFERLLSGSPNSSEVWIRYMAFHLSLADVASARAVAERAFARIEFREEREKLNVWCALLTLEHKYGSPSSFQATIDRACQQNNPKHVYLRVCEMVEKEVNPSSPETVVLADEMFNKMCRKFKSKKKAWLAFAQYLLKSGRHKDAHDLLRRSMKSLPEYKHVETMSKFAQLEFEFGSPDRARTLFDGIVLKNPKRLDLVFVYADKEVKHGSIEMARALFERLANPRGDAPKAKLSDKQMKSLFKKWYRIEEIHGTTETQANVKVTAKAYVQRGSA